VTDADSERRRSPRVEVVNHSLSMRATAPVRVVDLSLGGVLLSCAARPPRTGTLNMVLGNTPFIATIEVRQRATMVGDAGTEQRAGAAFVDMNPGSRRALEHFLRSARPT